MPDNTEHYNLPVIGGPGVQNVWALFDTLAALVERGRTVKVTAGQTLGARDVVFLDPADLKVKKATHDNRPVLGFTTTGAVMNEQVFVQVEGLVIDDQPTPTWNWTPGALLYPHPTTAGALTQTATGHPVAIALSATAIWVLQGVLHLRKVASTTRALYLAVHGAVSAGTGVSMIVPSPIPGTITAIKSTCRVAPSSTYTMDINKNGTTIYTTQANRPQRTAGNGTGLVTHAAPDVTTVAADDLFTVDVDSAGADLQDLLFMIVFAEA
jgi:hypothetical protein